MGGLELILIALLPLALLAVLPDSRSDDDSGPEPTQEPAEEDAGAQGDLLDMAEDSQADPAPGPETEPATEPEPAAQAGSFAATAQHPLTEPAEPASPIRSGATLGQKGTDAVGAPAPSDGLPPPDAALSATPPSAPSDGLPSDSPHDSAELAAGSPEFAGYMSPEAILGSPDADSLQPPPGGAAVFANGLDGQATAGNHIAGGPGDDTLLGGAGSDTLTGTAGENVIRASYDPNLEIAQGADLFCWRDNGLPDVLEGGSDNDRLIFARGDTATGGGGANVFEVWHDPHSPQPAAVVTDFTPGQDRLDIVIRIDEADHPDCGAWAWDRQVQASVYEGATPSIVTDAENDHTEIRLGEETLARLLGTPPLTPDDLRLFAFWDITT